MDIRRTALAAAFVALIAAAPCAAETSLRSGFSYNWWNDTREGVGRQAYVPVTVEVRRGDLSVAVLGAIHETSFTRGAQANSRMSGALDTKVTSSWALTGRFPVDISLGLDLNLPTGKTDLSQDELVLLMDPDLVPVTTFGEGFNVNPTLSVAKAWGDWIAGVGAGYAFRGKYDFSSDLNMKDFKPGDVVTANAIVKRALAPGWSGRLFGNAAWYRKETAQGIARFREGDFYAVGAGIDRSWERASAGLSLKAVLRQKTRVPDGAGGLSTEPENIHGNEYWATVTARCRAYAKTLFTADATGLLITENGYPQGSPRHVGARRKVALGLGVARDLGEGLEAGLSVKGFVMHDGERSFPQPLDARSYRGASAVLSLGKSF